MSFTGIIISGSLYNLIAEHALASTGLILAGTASLGFALLLGLCVSRIQKSRLRIDPSLKSNPAAVTLSTSIFNPPKPDHKGSL